MRLSSLVFLAATLCSASAFAQVGAATNPMPNSASPVTTTQSTPATNPVPTGDATLDQVVCKQNPPPTGSRIGTSRTCKTQREWLADEDAMNRARNQQDQTQNVMSGGGTGHSMGGGGH